MAEHDRRRQSDQSHWSMLAWTRYSASRAGDPAAYDPFDGTRAGAPSSFAYERAAGHAAEGAAADLRQRSACDMATSGPSATNLDHPIACLRGLGPDRRDRRLRVPGCRDRLEHLPELTSPASPRTIVNAGYARRRSAEVAARSTWATTLAGAGRPEGRFLWLDISKDALAAQTQPSEWPT